MTYEEVEKLMEEIESELRERPCPKSGSFAVWMDKNGNVRWGWYYISHEPYAFVSFSKLLWRAEFTGADWGYGEEGDEDYVSPELDWETHLEDWLTGIKEAITDYLKQRETFEKDVGALRELIEGLEKEGWEVEREEDKVEESYHLKGKGAVALIRWGKKGELVACEYKRKLWASLARIYEDYEGCTSTKLEVGLGGGVYVSFVHKKAGREEGKGVNVEKYFNEFSSTSISLPAGFYEAYAAKTSSSLKDELFESLKLPESFVEFFEKACGEAKLLADELKVREMPKEAFELNEVLWRALVELEEKGRIRDRNLPFLEGILRIEEAGGIRITYVETYVDSEKNKSVDEYVWTIGRDGTIKREEKISVGKGRADAEKIEEALVKWCQPAIRYFCELIAKEELPSDAECALSP